ncbi:gamma-tubulin complex component [Brachionus plicatilis]|uniref:Gamma-tubulin complex component n=1 Tax=Brachionus plicatilis TaxID=10195 RepID=A0A3M7RN59_BRAPC|nr:gamma-tubulin complex component [Brachionus plicatilis]
MCLHQVCYYANVVFRMEHFVKTLCQTRDTQVYEAFGECIIEFLKFYKLNLNKIASQLAQKIKKFTLIDFLNTIHAEYFTLLDTFSLFLTNIDQNKSQTAFQKSLNLLVYSHRILIDSFSHNNHVNRHHKLLIFIFTRLLAPYLKLIDTFVRDGVLLDPRNELGFVRQKNISINSVQYWSHGYTILLGSEKVPLFVKIILSSSFKICKQIEILNRLESSGAKSDIYAHFMAQLREKLNFFKREEMSQECERPVQGVGLLGMSFFNQMVDKKSVDLLKIDYDPFGDNFLGQKIDFNLETMLDQLISECYYDLINLSSVNLLENLFKKYHMFDLFRFIHSYYFFLSNEIIYLFSEKLFNMVKKYETYQDDVVLNSVFYNAANSVFENDADNYFNFNFVSFHYEAPDTGAQNCKLVTSVRLNVRVDWPLNIIVTQEDFTVYNQVFAFLVKIKQVKNDLERLEKTDLDLNVFGKKKLAKSALLVPIDEVSVRKMYLIRMKLLNFVNNAHNLIGDQ